MKSGSKLPSIPEQIEPDSIAVTSITLNSSSLSLVEGDTTTLTVEYAPLNATNKSTTWKSSDDKVATVSSDGKVTALKAGNATITAICGTNESSCLISITSKPVELNSISLNEYRLELKEGESSKLSVIFSPFDATVKNVNWKSSDTDVATVDKDGNITAVGAGYAKITVSCGKFKSSCSVYVTKKEVDITSCSFERSSIEMKVGDTLTLNLIINPYNAYPIEFDSSRILSRSYSGHHVVEIDDHISERNRKIFITATNEGTATYVLNFHGAKSHYKLSGTFNVIRNNKQITSIQTVTGTHNGFEYVDMGLSVKWATCNIDASKPEDCGGYYAFGETSTKNNYSWSTYKYCNGDWKQMTKYNKESRYGYNGYTDDFAVLEMIDDVAHTKWGGSWRIPTKKELQELIDNCTWTWTTFNGINGFKITSKKAGYTDRSIFLPAMGYVRDRGNYWYGSRGCYWSSSLDEDSTYSLYCSSMGDIHMSYENKSIGCTIRPVCP